MTACVLKVQRALWHPDNPAGCLIYDRNRSFELMVDLPAACRAAIFRDDRIKVFVRGCWDGLRGDLVIDEFLDDQHF
ncbi:MAG: hypothetical protein IPK78_18010 [Rhodospirillales bacterium]|nr:hypothetical protein [Rhodospirillales bacterium]